MIGKAWVLSVETGDYNYWFAVMDGTREQAEAVAADLNRRITWRVSRHMREETEDHSEDPMPEGWEPSPEENAYVQAGGVDHVYVESADGIQPEPSQEDMHQLSRWFNDEGRYEP